MQQQIFFEDLERVNKYIGVSFGNGLSKYVLIDAKSPILKSVKKWNKAFTGDEREIEYPDRKDFIFYNLSGKAINYYEFRAHTTIFPAETYKVTEHSLFYVDETTMDILPDKAVRCTFNDMLVKTSPNGYFTFVQTMLKTFKNF
ncbi:MAG: hypothetical protein V3U54_12925 [Thermodesulfobacteriota bacterium]